MSDEQQQIPLPLDPQLLKFVDAYLSYRDVGKAAVEAGYQSKAGAGIYRRKAVHDEIQRRMAGIDGEVDKIIAKKRMVNVEALDKNLMQVVTIPRKTLIETPQLAASKVKAIELGYQRVGLLLDGNFVPDASSGPEKQEAPRIYRSAEQTIITHQITETHQTVVQRATTAPQAPKQAACTIDSDDDDWKGI
jgi:hypothetical protein